MIKPLIKQTLLTKAIKTSLLSFGVVGFFISSSAFSALTCKVGSSKFYSKSAIIKDVTVKNTGSKKATNVKITLTFNRAINFTKAWGDVRPSPIRSGKKLVFKAKSRSLNSGKSIDFGLKGKNINSTSSVSCTATQDNASLTSKNDKKTTKKPTKNAKKPVNPKKPIHAKKPTKNTSPTKASSQTKNTVKLGLGTYFDGLGDPYGGCGIPEKNLETPYFVALNTFHSPKNYKEMPRPIKGKNLKYLGAFNNGKNCGRWIKVSVKEYCDGINDGAKNKAFCRKGNGFIKDGLEGATLNMLVADSCADGNAWCRDNRNHLDLSRKSVNQFKLNGEKVNLLPDNFNNRLFSWKYIPAPNYTGDIKVYFVKDAEFWWPAIAINHLENGIHKVEEKINGKWVNAKRNGDLGQAFILKGGKNKFTIRVTDANGKLVKKGRTYTFALPKKCKNGCPGNLNNVKYTTGS